MRRSAGIIPYKIVDNDIYIYLEHPGGPYWKGINKWSICKGEFNKGKEKATTAAVREFYEESNFKIEEQELDYLSSYKVSNNKLLIIFIANTDIDCSRMKSNTFKKVFNGVLKEFPEMDEAKWFKLDDAVDIIFDNQVVFLNKLKEKVSSII